MTAMSSGVQIEDGMGGGDGSLWEKMKDQLRDNPENQKKVQELYANYEMPIEIRHFFCEAIERVFLPSGSCSVPEDSEPDPGQVSQLLQTMITSLTEKCNASSGDVVASMHLNGVLDKLKYYLNQDAKMFACRMQCCLNEELRMVGHSLEITHQVEEHAKASIARNISELLDKITQRVENSNNNIASLREFQENFLIKVEQYKRKEQEVKAFRAAAAMGVGGAAENGPIASAAHEAQLAQHVAAEQQAHTELVICAQNIQDHRDTVYYDIRDTVEIMKVLKTQIYVQIVEWCRTQQSYSISCPIPDILEKQLTNDLDRLQAWCERLADNIIRSRIQVKSFMFLRETVPLQSNSGGDPDTALNNISQLASELEDLLKDFVEKTFVVEKQPPQILKKDTKFSAAARHLVGNKLTNHVEQTLVKVDLYSDLVARDIFNCQTLPSAVTTAAVLSNNQAPLDYLYQQRVLRAQFRNLCLTKLKRTERRTSHTNESVMEEKLRFIFHTEFKLCSESDPGNFIIFSLIAMSLPIVATVHGSQEAKAAAVVLWDNKFSNQFIDPFEVPDKVSWYEVAELLNDKFVMGGEVNHLGSQDLAYLSSKLLHHSPAESEASVADIKVTWNQFYRELLPGRTFTFWEWFYEITELLHDVNFGKSAGKPQLNLKDLWNKNYIRGFLSKDTARELLMSTQVPGTFLIRFADSEKGAVSISWLCCLPGSTNEVYHLKPFTHKDLQTRSLADRIRDLHDLTYLYPNWPKDYVFGDYYSSKESFLTANHDGYIGTELRTDIPMVSARTAVSGALGGGGSSGDPSILDDILDLLRDDDDFPMDSVSSPLSS